MSLGLSGLITPFTGRDGGVVATEMEKAGLKIPLMIGGATTSKAAHRRLKIEPKYSHGGSAREGCIAKTRRPWPTWVSDERREGYIKQVRGRVRTVERGEVLREKSGSSPWRKHVRMRTSSTGRGMWPRDP